MAMSTRVCARITKGVRARRWVTGAALISLAATAAACGGSAKSSSSPTTTTSTSAATTSTTAPRDATTVDVYFVRAQKLVAAGSGVPAPGTPESAVRALLAGPRAGVEHDLGFTSSIPAATTLNGVDVTGTVATVDLSRSFASGGGSQSMQARVAQVVFTVTQFPSIDAVRFRLDGTAVTSIGGEGLMVDRVGRDAFTNVTPAIMVESPTPGQSVRSTIHVRGIANTFERTVNYTLTDPAGVVLKESFTTGTGAAPGAWGPFAFDVSFTPTRTGLGTLTVYQISGENGSHNDVVSVPLQMQG